MSKISKKKKSIVAIVLAAILILGMSFAYFTDYATTSTSGTAGTVAVSLDSDVNLLDANGNDILNPGDMRDAGFTVTNEGNKSIDVRTTIVLTTQSNSGQSLTFSGATDVQSEYDLYLRSDVEEIPGEGWKPKTDAVPLQVKAIDGDTITYQPAIYSLNGNSDRYNEVETIDGINAFSQINDYVLIMKGEAGNEWQNSIVSIDVLVEAKQHENTSAGWDIVAQENVATGAINQSAVKGENVITAGGTVPTYVTVTAKDENGQDVQMASTVVEGAEKEELLTSLGESGLVNAEDVDLIINVEASEFDGTVNATFDVSSIASAGDTVAIYHYDEAAGEWEYITTAVVDENGTVSGDFSSFSPVAFDVITTDTPDAATSEYKLTFVYEDTRNPIPNADVIFYPDGAFSDIPEEDCVFTGYSDMTDENGVITISGDVAKNIYNSAEDEILLCVDAVYSEGFAMDKTTAIQTIVVKGYNEENFMTVTLKTALQVDYLEQKIIPNTPVTLYSWDGREIGNYVTDENGQFDVSISLLETNKKEFVNEEDPDDAMTNYTALCYIRVTTDGVTYKNVIGDYLLDEVTIMFFEDHIVE